MIHGDCFEKTRQCYASRCLGYGQVADHDFALITDISSWVDAVKQISQNLPKIVDVFLQWKMSPSNSKHFAIWDGHS